MKWTERDDSMNEIYTISSGLLGQFSCANQDKTSADIIHKVQYYKI